MTTTATNMHRTARLSNGLEIQAEIDPLAHTAAVGFFVRTGSRELGRGALVRLPGLEAGLQYRVAAPGPLSKSVEGSLAPALRDGKLLMNGGALASRGLDLFLPRPETSLLLHVKAV